MVKINPELVKLVASRFRVSANKITTWTLGTRAYIELPTKGLAAQQLLTLIQLFPVNSGITVSQSGLLAITFDTVDVPWTIAD